MTRRLSTAAVLVLGCALGAAAQVGTNDTLLNANLATAQELAAVPELEADGASAVLGGRPFLDVANLDQALAALSTSQQRQELYKRMWVPINLENASRDSILLIPGVGERMAHEFEEYRPYGALARFRREIAKYVDDEELARLERYVFVPLNLNTASAADFMTIPGVGERMTHEFMEYRPYSSMEQFRREIGKYVDDDEVARLERYMKLD